MQCQEKQTDNVKTRDVNVLKSVDHHRINVEAIERIEFEEWKLRIEFASGEMKQMKNDEREHDQSAYDHVARGPACLHVISIAIAFGTRATILDRKENGEINVQDDGDQEKGADHPQERAEVAQMLRIGVDPFRSEKDLKIA